MIAVMAICRYKFYPMKHEPVNFDLFLCVPSYAGHAIQIFQYAKYFIIL